MTAAGHSDAWIQDCMKWRGRVLVGAWAHWCFDWDELPVDETTPDEMDCCHCLVHPVQQWKP